MDRAARRAAIALAALALGVPDAFAGAWTLDRSAGQVIFSLTAKDAVRAFDASGASVSRPAHRKRELSAYVEYGATDWLTLVFSPTLERTTIAAPSSARYQGLGYTEFGARARFWQAGAWVGSVQVLGRAAGAADRSDPAQAGKTAHQVDARLLVGRSFSVRGRPAFVDVQAGRRMASGKGAGEYRLEASAGIHIRPRLLLLAQSFNALSNRGGGLGTRPRRHEVQFSAVWALSRAWSLQLGAVATVAGREALRERGLVAALWRRF
ncbi:hypothetical protein ACUN0C_00400 [Faunimonas sp. B44]|uniref:hypothetical protein n=1 Tax=Faunimonas sp. B44 TaxID=3461493 RepID=UPI004043EC75